MSDSTNGNARTSKPRYDLSPDELGALECDLVETLKELGFRDCVAAAWITPNHEFANIARMHEAKYFPEVQELPDVVEDSTLFLVLADTRDDVDRVVHAATVSGQDVNRDEARVTPVNQDESTGFIVVEDLIEMGNFTPQEFRDYYAAAGIDLDRCISVETNFYIGKRAPRFRGMTSSDLAYLAIFEFFMGLQPEFGRAVAFASINRPSIVSFGWIGLEYEPLMGRTDLVTSESQRGLRYVPITIPYNAHNLPIFESMGEGLPKASF